MKSIQEQITRLTFERDQARELAEKYRDKYISNYEDSALYLTASKSHKLPWENSQ